MKITSDSAKGYATIGVVLAVIVIVFIILNKFLKFGGGITDKIGLTDSASEKQNAATIKTTVNSQLSKGGASYWSPNYYKTLNIPTGVIRLNQLGIDKVVNEFWNSVGYLWDSTNKGVAAIKMVTSGYQLSQVVEGFQIKYGLDLLTWMENKYDTEEQKRNLVEILKVAAQLKAY